MTSWKYTIQVQFQFIKSIIQCLQDTDWVWRCRPCLAECCRSLCHGESHCSHAETPALEGTAYVHTHTHTHTVYTQASCTVNMTQFKLFPSIMQRTFKALDPRSIEAVSSSTKSKHFGQLTSTFNPFPMHVLLVLKLNSKLSYGVLQYTIFRWLDSWTNGNWTD